MDLKQYPYQASKVNSHSILIIKEDSDPKFYRESTLLYHIKKMLNQDGYNLIKKLMWKDGHLVSDSQHYLRTKNKSCNKPHICMWDNDYQIRLLHKDFNNNGHVCLTVLIDIFDAEYKTYK